jgi:peptide-methionine (S)-S-oxide reductase
MQTDTLSREEQQMMTQRDRTSAAPGLRPDTRGRRQGWIAALACTALIAASLGAAHRTAAPSTATGPATLAAPAAGDEVAVFSGGCFWGIQAVFEHVRGVTGATSGYTGGAANTATYDEVSTSTTGHAESVRVTFDPKRVSYADLLKVFFTVHDPTELDRQGPDEGTQYRSVVWYTSDAQRLAAEGYVRQLTAAKVFSRPIVTQISPLKGFYVAEGYHQDYFVHNPDAPYIVINDKPKVERLKSVLPALYSPSPVLYAAAAEK